MPRARATIGGGLFLALLLPYSQATAQEEKVTLEPQEKWSNVFAEAKVTFHFKVSVPEAFKGRVEWTFADASKRVFPRGRGETPIAAGAKPAPVKISLQMPPVNAGVVLEARLVVSVYADGQSKAATVFEKTMWIYPPDPFANRKKWLEELEITLYDPDSKSKTAEMLRGLKVPFEEIRNSAALGDVKKGLLLVGEGASFQEEAGLAEALVQAAGRGLPVLCLAPSAGTFPIPQKEKGPTSPGSLFFQNQDIIRKLDKRLDAVGWAPDNQVVASSLILGAEDGKVVGTILEGDKGWSWLQLDYPSTKGRLILCGFALTRQWDAGPAPRYLLARLLEHVSELTPKNLDK
jgi:hypothetical protein